MTGPVMVVGAGGRLGASVVRVFSDRPVLALDRTRQAALFTSLRGWLGVQRWPGCEAEPVLNAETLIPMRSVVDATAAARVTGEGMKPSSVP